jgi:hypothetical protein
LVNDCASMVWRQDGDRVSFGGGGWSRAEKRRHRVGWLELRWLDEMDRADKSGMPSR